MLGVQIDRGFLDGVRLDNLNHETVVIVAVSLCLRATVVLAFEVGDIVLLVWASDKIVNSTLEFKCQEIVLLLRKVCCISCNFE